MCAVRLPKPLPSPAAMSKTTGFQHTSLPRVKMIISNWCWLCKPDGDGEGSGAGDDVAVVDGYGGGGGD